MSIPSLSGSSQHQTQDIAPARIAFRDNVGFLGKAAYWLTRPVAIGAFYRVYHPRLLDLVGYRVTVEQCKAFLVDIGGEPLTLTTADGAELDATYFSPDAYKQNENSVFDKWQGLLSSPAYRKTKEMFEADLDGKDLTSLMGLPANVPESKNDEMLGVVWCMGASNLYEFDAQAAMMYLLRGKHVVLFNYRGVLFSKGTPNGRTTCLDALAVCEWLQSKLNCENNRLCVHGKSMGTGPATYVGAAKEGMDVIIDRGFCRMSAVIDSKLPKALCCFPSLAHYAIEHFYAYPNEDLIPLVKGRVLILEAENDKIMDPFHAERLFDALKKSKSPSKDELEAFRGKYWVKAAGTHSSICGGDEDYSWYRDSGTQGKLSNFIFKI